MQDMYTRDRSTPREDYWYAGNDDLTGSAGSQVDGYTTIVFRRRLRGNGELCFFGLSYAHVSFLI